MTGHGFGFEWGFRPAGEKMTEQSGQAGGQTGGLSTGLAAGQASGMAAGRIMKPRVKRRHTEEDIGHSHSHAQAHASAHAGVRKRKPFHRNYIQGQALPFPRSVELMDKQTLQSVLLSIVRDHPEVQHTVLARVQSQSVSMEQYVKLLDDKLQQVFQDIPYSRYNQGHTGQLNDYAFGRVKASMMEFLNCVVDFLLASIPPQCTNVLHSLKFLNCCTERLIQLPDFETLSNNYYKNMCFEQLAEVWCSSIQFATSDLSFMSVASNLPEWESILEGLNYKSNNKLHKPLDLIASIKRTGSLVSENSTDHRLSQPAQTSAIGFLNISS